MSAFRLRRAADVLLGGGVIAHPTEGVWGLACLPRYATAVARILELKQRHPSKGLILLAGDAGQFAPLLRGLPDYVLAEMGRHWPGPYTYVVPDPKNTVPDWVKGSHETVAIRVSDHLLTSSLSALVGSPLVSTSANPSGADAAKTLLKARQYFGTALDYYLAGETGGRSGPSQIVDALSGKLLRA